MALPDPAMGPRTGGLSGASELRKLATLEGECRVCPARPRFAGVDYQEMRHSEFEHAPGCRCGDEKIAARLRHRGLRIDEERYLLFAVDLEMGHRALEGAA